MIRYASIIFFGKFICNTHKYWLVACLFIIVKLLLHLFTNTNYELHRDEMLYFNMSDHIDWGYASVPPMIGFWSFLVKTFFGYSVFAIRLLPAILGTFSIFIIAKIIKEIGGGVWALAIAATSFVLSPGFLIFDTLFTPNVLEQFLWLLIIYLLIRMVRTNNPRLWIFIGIATGLALLTKYSVVILVFSFIISLLSSRYKYLFLSKYFYYSNGIAVLIFLPNIYWQYSHNWPVFGHIKELNETQMANMTYCNFLLDAISLNLAASVIWLIGLFSILFVRREKKYRFIGMASLLIIMLFILSKGKAYYFLGIIPVLFVFGGYVLEKYLKNTLRTINYILLVFVVLVSLFALPYALPVLTYKQLGKYSEKTGRLSIFPFSRWEDGKIHSETQVYADMTGWQELANLTSIAYNRLSKEEQTNATIYCERNYGYAGSIHFYGKEYNLPEPVTFSDSYTLWAPDSIPNGVLIYIHRNDENIQKLFNTIELVGEVDNKFFRENGVKVYLCAQEKVSISNVYKELANEEKSRYHN